MAFEFLGIFGQKNPDTPKVVGPDKKSAARGFIMQHPDNEQAQRDAAKEAEIEGPELEDLITASRRNTMDLNEQHIHNQGVSTTTSSELHRKIQNNPLHKPYIRKQ